jgi:hypothetical protein
MKQQSIVLALVLAAAGCGSEPPLIHENFKFNQLGFHPLGEKIAVIPAGDAGEFALLNAEGSEVYRAPLGEPRSWPYSDEQVRIADFSAYTGSGRFKLRAGKLPPSPEFGIDPDAYRDLNRARIGRLRKPARGLDHFLARRVVRRRRLQQIHRKLRHQRLHPAGRLRAFPVLLPVARSRHS